MVIEPYRLKILSDFLGSYDADGIPTYNLALCGRGKKNWKTADLVLASLYKFLVCVSPQGNDCFILANDEDQAKDDLNLMKKIIDSNPILAHAVKVQAKSIIRNDNGSTLSILPAKDIAGAHGKTYLFCAFDEIHGYKNHDLFEALAMDPTRPDAQIFITSYASLYNNQGAPLHDLIKQGKAGTDPRMYFSWFSGDYCTDSEHADLPTPELRANPSIASWNAPGYLEQQKRRLPTNKYRRLHLNLPGAPDGVFLDANKVLACIVSGRKHLPPSPNIKYQAFVDMSGGSGDDATLGISHKNDDGNPVLDFIDKQAGKAPFNPRKAVTKFAGIMREYRVSRVVGDAYAGETFRRDFEDEGISYTKSPLTKSGLYEQLEPIVNAGNVELLDHPTLESQLLTLVSRGNKVDHQSGDHDDHANAAAGAIYLAAEPIIQRRAVPMRY